MVCCMSSVCFRRAAVVACLAAVVLIGFLQLHEISDHHAPVEDDHAHDTSLRAPSTHLSAPAADGLETAQASWTLPAPAPSASATWLWPAPRLRPGPEPGSWVLRI